MADRMKESKRHAAYYLAHRTRLLAARAAYRAAHLEECRAYDRARYHDCKDVHKPTRVPPRKG